MSIPVCQHIGKLRNECEHAYGSANSYTRRHHEDPDYVDENEWEFIRTFSDQTHKNYLLARHLKATSNGQWKTLQWLMQGDLDAVLDKRMAHKTSGTGVRNGRAGECCDDSTRTDKSIFVPLTSYFGPERIEEFVAQGQGSQHLLDFAVKKMKNEKLDMDVHANENKNIETFPDNDPNRIKYGNKITDMLMKRALGTTGFARIDEDLERPDTNDRKIFGLDLERTGRVKSMTDYSHRPTAGYYTNYKRNAERNQMKNYIKTISKFYASVAEPQSIKVDSIERLTQTIEEEFYKTVSYHIPSYGKRDPSKVRLSAVIRKLKSMPGYAAFQAVLYHEPFDRNKPWTWMRTFPKRIPKEYLKRVSENIVNDMKKWKRQQKITALTYSPGKRIIDVAKSKRLQKKRGRRNLKTRNQKEVTDNDVDIVEKQD
uniref:Probable endonuclease LCL3 n=1 Tax=Zeugodacus cucurbitae TaxID=28588 RepID=A0A0A1WN06_ZEUCU